MCVVALGGGMRGCSRGVVGACMVAPGGACMVAPEGHVWLFQGACVVAWGVEPHISFDCDDSLDRIATISSPSCLH